MAAPLATDTLTTGLVACTAACKTSIDTNAMTIPMTIFGKTVTLTSADFRDIIFDVKTGIDTIQGTFTITATQQSPASVALKFDVIQLSPTRQVLHSINAVPIDSPETLSSAVAAGIFQLYTYMPSSETCPVAIDFTWRFNGVQTPSIKLGPTKFYFTNVTPTVDAIASVLNTYETRIETNNIKK